MALKRSLAAAGLIVPGAFGLASEYQKNGLTWSKGALRMNQIQVVGTHNSYHIESELDERAIQEKYLPSYQDYFYSHPALDIQIGDQLMRNIELDILADPDGGNYAKPLIRQFSGLAYDDDPVWNEPGAKVQHVPDIDIHGSCKSLKTCLQVIKGWMDKHPKAVPLAIMTEFKTSEPLAVAMGGAKIIAWNDTTLLKSVDDEIRSVFGSKQLLTPDDIRRDNMTLEESILKYGWPDLESARGRIFFLMDNGVDVDDGVHDKYIESHKNLEGRVLFTNSVAGQPDCAFQKINDPTGDNLENIQKQVKAGYWVRTRSDEPISTVTNCTTTRRDAAFNSGAQVVTTDFQAYGMSSRWQCDYVVRLEHRKPARCNPVNHPAGCDDSNGFEPDDYRF